MKYKCKKINIKIIQKVSIIFLFFRFWCWSSLNNLNVNGLCLPYGLQVHLLKGQHGCTLFSYFSHHNLSIEFAMLDFGPWVFIYLKLFGLGRSLLVSLCLSTSGKSLISREKCHNQNIRNPKKESRYEEVEIPFESGWPLIMTRQRNQKYIWITFY